jgi:hypothetical protein
MTVIQKMEKSERDLMKTKRRMKSKRKKMKAVVTMMMRK